MFRLGALRCERVLRFAAIVCLLAACEGEPAGPDADPNDLDGDGIANADDNCANDRNPDQHDEDGDLFGDACDNCPATANPTQADTTEVAVNAFADGVGDACDYRPGLSGDVVGAFFTWATEEQSSAWTGSGWMISADELHTAGAARWQAERGEQGDGLIVVARMTAVDLAGGAVTLAIDGDGINAGVTCTLRATGSGSELVANEIGGAMELTSVTPTSFVGSQSLVAWRRITAASSELACRLERGTQQTENTITLVDDLITGAYSISSGGAAVSLSSLIVLTSPGPRNP